MTSTSKPPANDADSAKRIALIPGDGVGREVVGEAARSLRAVAEVFGRALDLAEIDWGADRYLRDGTTLPEGGEQMLRDKFDAVLLRFGKWAWRQTRSHRTALPDRPLEKAPGQRRGHERADRKRADHQAVRRRTLGGAAGLSGDAC